MQNLERPPGSHLDISHLPGPWVAVPGWLNLNGKCGEDRFDILLFRTNIY
jgi:hypothetical protein